MAINKAMVPKKNSKNIGIALDMFKPMIYYNIRAFQMSLTSIYMMLYI